jgi:hypothetical protein
VQDAGVFCNDDGNAIACSQYVQLTL